MQSDLMKSEFLCRVLIICALVCAASGSDQASAQQQRRKSQRAKVCFDPTARCKTSAVFQSYDLPFRLPQNAVIYETETFYAIILKSVRNPRYDCNVFVSEEERLEAQALFPNHKVFTSRCAEAGSLFYTGVADKTEIMAVYAGATRAEANTMLARVKATGRFPGANLRRMRAGFNGT